MNYEDEEEEQGSRRRPQRHSVPLRTHSGTRTAQRTTEEGVRVPPGGIRPPFGSSRPAQRPQPAQPTSTTSHISHTALQVFPDDDRRVGRSQLRYINAQGEHVWRQGKQQVVFHPEEPPRRRRPHWLFWVGIGMVLMIALVVGWNLIGAAFQAHTLESTYGYPPTWQTDAVVGHEDSPSHPSHFLFENLHGQVLITEYPGGNIAHARIYSGGAILRDHADLVPVTGRFVDVNHNGHPEMLVDIGTGTSDTQTITFLNNGTLFIAPA